MAVMRRSSNAPHIRAAFVGIVKEVRARARVWRPALVGTLFGCHVFDKVAGDRLAESAPHRPFG